MLTIEIMNKDVYRLFILVLVLFGGEVFGQELKGKIPANSPGQRLEQDFGLGTVSVSYYRPSTKGRVIFGNIEPYGQVWRTGANNATVITFSDTVRIEGQLVLPGAYSLFSIPGPATWTVILNKNTGQWGAYTYNQKDDVLRVNVKPVKLPARVETLSFQFTDMEEEDCRLQIQWETTSIPLRLHTDIVNRVWANIQEAMKTEKKPYFAAVWCYRHNLHLDQALTWMLELDRTQPPTFSTKYWLARLQLKTGDKAAAVATANEGIRLATAAKSTEYIRLNTEVLRDAGAKK